jgi:ABC-type Fe3+-citrate transport system substrate-binding protein
MKHKLKELIDEYDNLLSSLEKIDHIVKDSKEGQKVIRESKKSLYQQYKALAELKPSDMKEYSKNYV